MFMLCYIAPFCRSFLCNGTGSFSILDTQCCEVSTQIIRIMFQILLMSVLPLSQIFSQENPCNLYKISSHPHYCTGQCSSNQPALHKSDVSGVPPLWKSCSDTDEDCLPKVDVRKEQTTLSDCLVCHRDKYNGEHYAFACTRRHLSCLAVLCTVVKALCLVFVTCVSS